MHYISTVSLLLSLSIDFLIAGVTLALSNIKVPKKAIIFLSIINTSFLIISIIIGSIIIKYLNSYLIFLIPSFIFIILGIEKILEAIIKKLQSKKYQLRIFNTLFILQIYNNPNKIDLDKSKTLSIKELIILSLSLSMDNFVIVIGLSISSYSILFILISNLIISYLLFYLANRYFINFSKSKDNGTLISGIIFLIIGIYRLF